MQEISTPEAACAVHAHFASMPPRNAVSRNNSRRRTSRGVRNKRAGGTAAAAARSRFAGGGGRSRGRHGRAAGSAGLPAVEQLPGEEGGGRGSGSGGGASCEGRGAGGAEADGGADRYVRGD